MGATTPANRAAAAAGSAVIDEFCDALWLEDGLAKASLASYRNDLLLLARLLAAGTAAPAAGGEASAAGAAKPAATGSIDPAATGRVDPAAAREVDLTAVGEVDLAAVLAPVARTDKESSQARVLSALGR